MSNKELKERIEQLEKYIVKITMSIPEIINNILLEKGILRPQPHQMTEEEILEEEKNIKKLNKGPGPKITGTSSMNKEEFKKYSKQLEEAINITKQKQNE